MGDKSQDLLSFIKKNKKSSFNNRLIILGEGALNTECGEDIFNAVKKYCCINDCKLFILHTAASKVGAMEMGCVSKKDIRSLFSSSQVVYNLGADEIDIGPENFVIYQGSHGDNGANRADIIFPGAAYTEESGIFVNTEGRS